LVGSGGGLQDEGLIGGGSPQEAGEFTGDGDGRVLSAVWFEYGRGRSCCSSWWSCSWCWQASRVR